MPADARDPLARLLENVDIFSLLTSLNIRRSGGAKQISFRLTFQKRHPSQIPGRNLQARINHYIVGKALLILNMDMINFFEIPSRHLLLRHYCIAS